MIMIMVVVVVVMMTMTMTTLGSRENVQQLPHPDSRLWC
jgi:hypothetical protein